jgi:pimeloyl-ACP methyl ester carboxylesterase
VSRQKRGVGLSVLTVLFLLAVALISTAASAGPAVKLPPGAARASVGGAQMAYRLSGSGPPLLLINGSGATLDTWDPKLLSALGRFHRVVVYDPRGLGGSTGTPASVLGDASDAAGLLASLQIRRADVIGWSYGGFVAQELAIDHPALVRRLVLVSTDHGGPTTVFASKQALALDSKVLLGAASPAETLQLLFPPAAFATGLAWFTRLAAQPGGCCESVNRSAARHVLASERAWYRSGGGTRSRLPRVHSQTLIVAGSVDIDVPPANARLLGAFIPTAKVDVVPGAGHAVLVQVEPHFLSEVKRFLG